MRKKLTALGALGAAAIVLLSGCAAPSTSDSGASTSPEGDVTVGSDISPEDTPQFASGQEIIDSFDITKICGDEEITLGFPQSVSNNWMKTAYKLIQDEAAKCPNIKEVITSDAQVDQQKAISDVNSMVAQGIDGIVTYPVFAQAQVPSFRAAMKAGVPVVTTIASSGGVIGTDIVAEVNLVESAFGEGWAEWLNTHMKEGTVLFVGGAPTSASSEARYQAAATALEKYPDLKLVEDAFVPGENTVEGKLAAVSGMLAKHGCIDAVLTDDGATDTAIIQAYEQAGCDLPYVGNSISANNMNCLWEEKDFPLMSFDGQQTTVVVAFRHLVASISGEPYDEGPWVKPFPYVDTLDDSVEAPKCDTSVPPLTDWSVPLTREEILEIAN